MATIEELLREEAEIRDAEIDALDQLNGRIAEIAGGLPKGSLLARRLALVVREFDRVIERQSLSRPSDVATWNLLLTLRDVDEDLGEQVEED